jgi:hypothetical protein
MNSTNPSPLNPFWRVELRTDAQVRLYNRILVAKIIVQVILILGILALCGWSPLQLVCAVLFAAAWKGIEIWSRRRKASAIPRA